MSNISTIRNVKEHEEFIQYTNIKEDSRIHFKIMSFLGMWIPTSYLDTKKEFLYRIYSLFCIIWMVIFPTLSEVIHVIMVLGDINKVVGGMFFTTCHLGWTYKVYVVMRHQNKIQKIFDTVDEPMFSKVDTESVEKMRTMTRRNYSATKRFLFMSALTCSTWALCPFMNADGLDLLIPAWYPVDKNQTHWFMICYMYQVVTTYYLGISNVVLDTLVSADIAIACGQLDALYDKLSDKHHRLVYADSSFSHKSFANREIEKHLSHCVELHNKIIGFVNESEIMFSLLSFVQFFASSIILCMTAFELTVVESTSELFGIFLYMICMLIELAMFSYFGNELISKSQNLCEAAYRSPWYEMSLPNRKYIFIIMEQAKRPLQVTAVVFTLSLSTLISVLRSSYSYYAVLKGVNNH